MQLSGPQSASFQVTGDRCTGQAVAGTCAVTVAFAPASVGTAAATLRVVGAAGTQDVALAGSATLRDASLGGESPGAEDERRILPARDPLLRPDDDSCRCGFRRWRARAAASPVSSS